MRMCGSADHCRFEDCKVIKMSNCNRFVQSLPNFGPYKDQRDVVVAKLKRDQSLLLEDAKAAPKERERYVPTKAVPSVR